MIDKFGGDSIAEMHARWHLFQEMAGEKVTNRYWTFEPNRSESRSL